MAVPEGLAYSGQEVLAVNAAFVNLTFAMRCVVPWMQQRLASLACRTCAQRYRDDVVSVQTSSLGHVHFRQDLDQDVVQQT